MTKIKLNLQRISATETIALANTIKTAMTGNASFPTPVVSLATLATLITNAQTAIAASDSANALAKQRTIEKNIAVDAVGAALSQLAAWAIGIVNGDEAKLASAGFPIASGPTGAFAMPQVHDLSATSGDNDGEIDLQWDKIKNAHSYEIQRSNDPLTADSWGNSVTCTTSKYAWKNLSSGTKLWFRVRAIGGAGPGPWSDPATKMVP